MSNTFQDVRPSINQAGRMETHVASSSDDPPLQQQTYWRRAHCWQYVHQESNWATVWLRLYLILLSNFFSRNRRGPKCSSCTTSRFLSSHIAHDKHIDAFHVAPHSLRRGSDVYFNAMQVLRPARKRIGRKRIPQSNKWKYQINLLISVHWTDEWIRAHVLTSPDSSFEWCDSSLALFFSQIC